MTKVSKPELIAAVAEHARLTRKDTQAALDAAFAVIEAFLLQGRLVPIHGFGTFSARVRPAGMVRNPSTGDMVPCEEKTLVKFKPSLGLGT